MNVFESHHAEQVNKLVSDLCKSKHIHAYAIASRRASDLLTFSVWGDRKAVLELPSMLLEQLIEEDIEILQSGRRGINYVLIFVVTQRVRVQATVSAERRAKLLRRARLYTPLKIDSETKDIASSQ